MQIIYLFEIFTLITFTLAIPTTYDFKILINNLFARDKSPNPAAESYSGCSLRHNLNCSGSHLDKGIQIGECWSNTRVMEQKSAFFVPVGKQDPSYYFEGGPYGDCLAFPCYPTSNDLQFVNNLANFCFFWDGKDHTIEQNGGLYMQFKRHQTINNFTVTNSDLLTVIVEGGGNEGGISGEENEISVKSKREKHPCYLSWLKLSRCKRDNLMEERIQKRDSKTKPKNKNHKQKPISKPKPASTNPGIPINNIPGKKVIPIPMICPSNLKGCYAETYFEKGGKLEVYANVKPTYEGDWFPPKDNNKKPMFCNGLNRGCQTPTMKQLQLQHLAEQHCDISKCHN